MWIKASACPLLLIKRPMYGFTSPFFSAQCLVQVSYNSWFPFLFCALPFDLQTNSSQRKNSGSLNRPSWQLWVHSSSVFWDQFQLLNRTESFSLPFTFIIRLLAEAQLPSPHIHATSVQNAKPVLLVSLSPVGHVAAWCHVPARAGVVPRHPPQTSWGPTELRECPTQCPPEEAPSLSLTFHFHSVCTALLSLFSTLLGSAIVSPKFQDRAYPPLL